jgi:hypothetical protein
MQSSDQLLRNLLHCCFGEFLIVLKNVEQFALGILSDNTELSIRLKGVKHQNDVFVIQCAQNFNFLSEIPYVLFALAVLGYKLHRDRESCVFASSLVDLAERPLPDVLQDDVLLHRSSTATESALHDVDTEVKSIRTLIGSP